ncbi:MAG: hypothetical protein KJZ98_10780 [Burkholderiaceae bacterium]|nr:hypothetical protein [Burkholderiaceae bacterium]MEB2350755.1 hypothetical protein [Burkholderiaceae bacterium]
MERPLVDPFGAGSCNVADAIRIRGGGQSSAIPDRPDARIPAGGGDGGALAAMGKENNTMIVPANLADVSTLVTGVTRVVRRQADLPGGAGRSAG